MTITQISVSTMLIALSTMFTAQIVKLITYSIRDKKINLSALSTTGGMPSSHAAFAWSAVFAYLYFNNWNFDMFVTFSIVFSLIITYDAKGIRLQASKHAIHINEINERLNRLEGVEKYNKALKESLGHTSFEVLIGIIMGASFGILGAMFVLHGIYGQ